MSDRFPPHHSQAALTGKSRSESRTHPVSAVVDLTLLAVLIFVVTLALL